MVDSILSKEEMLKALTYENAGKNRKNYMKNVIVISKNIMSRGPCLHRFKIAPALPKRPLSDLPFQTVPLLFSLTFAKHPPIA